MIAHHPKNGKEIRIIQTDASVWRENKTLSYSDTPSIWETIYHSGFANGNPDYRIFLNAKADPKVFKSSKIVLVSNIETSEFKKLRITNAIVLEEVHLLYPHLGAAWDGTVEDAVTIMAGLLRFRRLAGSWNWRAEALGLVKETRPPAKLWWICQFFKHGKSARAAEIRKCLRENASSPLIDKILLLNEGREDFPKSHKIQEEVIGHRLTYRDVFERIYTIPDNTIVVFANADIFIDASFKDLWSLNLEDKFLALLRYELPASDLGEATLFGPRADSQDTWIVRSDDVKRRDRSAWSKMDFQFGKMGCDNGIAMEMMRQKFLVSNPSQTLRTYHVHTSEIRNYSKTDVVNLPAFHYVQPTAIHDLIPEFKLPEILELGPCFQTPDGLVFDSTKMYVGDSEASKQAWSKANIHGLMPTLEVGRGLVAPWPAGAEKSREIYCLKYISKILRLWSISPGEFYGCDYKGCLDVLKMFKWGVPSLPVVTREEDSLVWCKKGGLVSVPCVSVSYMPVSKDDIAALRKYVQEWTATCESKKVVIVEDGVTLKAKRVLEIETFLEEAGYDVHIVYPAKTSLERLMEVYGGAWGIVCAGNLECAAWNWMLPEGAHVFEVGAEEGMAKEISDAAGLVHKCVKGDLFEAIVNAGRVIDPGLPTIWMPAPLPATNFFYHPGDSFREMVRLWEKAGYVNVREHAGVQVWWGEVGAGGVLLYDRPTNEWRLAAGASEREWKLALFGNPKVPAGATGSPVVPWTFWPRRPSLVEVIASGKSAGWDERRAGPVFYGKTENAIQERRRRGDWAAVCEEWVMVKDKEKYPFTQSEYLEKLASSRFGLCLPGYGLKCHREIECMAMGCVPIVLKGVDMSSYDLPPMRGKHYIEVDKPEDVPIMVGRIDRETWEEMSAACKEWWAAAASVAGSFEVTSRIIGCLTG